MVLVLIGIGGELAVCAEVMCYCFVAAELRKLLAGMLSASRKWREVKASKDFTLNRTTTLKSCLHMDLHLYNLNHFIKIDACKICNLLLRCVALRNKCT